MSYRIESVRGGASENRDIAEFLADFVRRGGLESPREGDDDPEVWEKRFRWWWDDNPACEDESPRGFSLLSAGGALIGFHGFIPVEYAVDEEVVPSLIATTFFIDEEHRSAAIGIISRLRRLGREYHIVDGSPSPGMREVLEKMGYDHSTERFQYFFPLGITGGVSRAMLRGVGLSFSPNREAMESGYYLAKSPEEVQTISPLMDGKMRQRITIESLDWMMKSGHEARQFFGLCDAYGKLVAYAIGIYKVRLGIRACMLTDYADWEPDQKRLSQLIGHLVNDPAGAGLDPATDLITWTTHDSVEKPAAGLKRDAILYYQIPPGFRDHERVCLPGEGDLRLL